MELEIKYGVFLKDKDNPEEWRIFAGWFSKYEDAYAVYNDLKSIFIGELRHEKRNNDSGRY